MDENKKDILEELEDGTEEVSEETEDRETELLEDAYEALDDMGDDVEEETESSEAEQYVDVKLLIDEVAVLRRQNKLMKRIFKAMAAVVVAVALFFGGVTAYRTFYNPYNNMGYYNMSEMTFADFSEMSGVSMEEAIIMYGLPEDLKADTYYDVVEFLIPLSYMAKINGVDVAVVKEVFGFGEEITDESTWGEALDSLTIDKYIELSGMEQTVEELISEYGLKSTVTGETLWGEVRGKINKVEYERFMAEKATEAEMDVTEAE